MEVRVRTEGGRRSILSVHDDGPGLSAEATAKVFERFYRGDPGRSRSTGGAGLGLSIAAAIVESHGGTIDVSSPEEGGASFVVRLPRRTPEDPAAAGPA